LDVTSPTPGTFTDGTNTLVLNKVELVLRKIELRRVEATASACADDRCPRMPRIGRGRTRRRS
jgi:hypothetical protein